MCTNCIIAMCRLNKSVMCYFVAMRIYNFFVAGVFLCIILVLFSCYD